jgi:hypothetical protein
MSLMGVIVINWDLGPLDLFFERNHERLIFTS